MRDERALVVMLDGDAAGEKERRDLQQFFGQKQIPFQANRDVVVRAGFPVEALFPDEWLVGVPPKPNIPAGSKISLSMRAALFNP